MRAEQKGSSRRPVAINDAFFGALATIINDHRQAVFRRAAEHLNLRAQDIVAVWEKREQPPAAPEYPSRSSDMAYAQYEKLYKEYESFRRVLTYIDPNTQLSCSVNYSSGIELQAETVEELIWILNREPDRVKTLSFHIGMSSALRLTLSFYETTTFFSASGERGDVQNLISSVTSLLRSSEPDHPWLHSKFKTLAGSVFFSLIISCWSTEKS